MIKISSFSLINNFARKTWEFHDNNLVVKVKSLTIDYEDEVPYDRISIIRNRKMKDLGWLWVVFFAIVLLGAIDLALTYFCLTNTTIITLEKVIAVLLLLLMISAFHTREFYSFLDADKNYLATVEVGTNDRNAIIDAVQLIKQKSKIVSETYLTDSLPSASTVFQIVEFDFPDFLNKASVNFYEDRLIAQEKSLVEEAVTLIRYDEFSGKTKHAKKGNNKWDNAGSYWFLFVCIIGVVVAIFFAEQISGKIIYLQLFVGGLLFTIPISLLKYIKKEIVIFYDNKDYGIFWLEVNSTNRAKINQIVSFVQEKVTLKN